MVKRAHTHTRTQTVHRIWFPTNTPARASASHTTMAVPIFAEGMFYSRIQTHIRTITHTHAHRRRRYRARHQFSRRFLFFFHSPCGLVCVRCAYVFTFLSLVFLLVCFVVACKTQMSERQARKGNWNEQSSIVVGHYGFKQKAIFHRSMPICILHFGYCCILVACNFCVVSLFSLEKGKRLTTHILR